jgi:peptide/nickel transport system permease protein
VLAPVTTFFSSMPYFWFALIILTIFAIDLNIFPFQGGYSGDTVVGWNAPFIGSAIEHAILPAFTIIVASLGGWLIGMRNMMVTTQSEDYMLVAEAKGLSVRRRSLSYAARNAILPNITSFALSLGFVVSGAILTEIVFSYPGIGYLLYQAVQNRDFPLMQGLFLIITLTVLGANLLADVSYTLLDPRTRKNG